MTDFWLALGFLTTLPARPVPYVPGGLGRAAVWFPVVGLLIGLLVALVAAVANIFFAPAVAAALVVAAWAALSGGLHLDGLIDCGDGLLVSAPRARRLEIMRDPRAGSFGVITVVLVLLIKAAAIFSLPSVWPALVVAPVWARWLILWTARQPRARPGGLGDEFASALTSTGLIYAALLPIAVTGLAMWWDWRILPAVALAALATYGLHQLARARIGGITGDVLGAVVEISEIVILAVMAH